MHVRPLNNENMSHNTRHRHVVVEKVVMPLSKTELPIKSKNKLKKRQNCLKPAKRPTKNALP